MADSFDNAVQIIEFVQRTCQTVEGIGFDFQLHCSCGFATITACIHSQYINAFTSQNGGDVTQQPCPVAGKNGDVDGESVFAVCGTAVLGEHVLCCSACRQLANCLDDFIYQNCAGTYRNKQAFCISAAQFAGNFFVRHITDSKAFKFCFQPFLAVTDILFI